MGVKRNIKMADSAWGQVNNQPELELLEEILKGFMQLRPTFEGNIHDLPTEPTDEQGILRLLEDLDDPPALAELEKATEVCTWLVVSFFRPEVLFKIYKEENKLVWERLKDKFVYVPFREFIASLVNSEEQQESTDLQDKTLS